MREQKTYKTIGIWLSLVLGASGQESRPGSGAAVEGVKGVKQDAVEKVKNIEPGSAAVVTGAKSPVQGNNKVEGVETISGVKATGRSAVLPQIVPPVIPAGGITVNSAGTIGTNAKIHAVSGVSGLNATKLQNLEAALKIKQDAGNPPTGSGIDRGAKGKSAAAALQPAPLSKPEPKVGPKEDGRAGFQEFEKLQTTGS